MNSQQPFFPPQFPPFWAVEWGQHRRFGLYAWLRVNDVRQCFRWIEPGTFLMGSPETEAERLEDETQHSVTLSKGFWLADTACTQALWLAVMGENPSYFNEDVNNPVEQVSWEDVAGFIQALQQKIPGLNARLPTEAEWEYACRAGTSTAFCFGDNISPEQVNYNGNYPYVNGAKGLYREKTVPVKSLPPNSWGLHEMHGNVLEWCADWYAADYDTTAEAATDPAGPVTGPDRVLRGGCWSYFGGRCRSAARDGGGPGLRYFYIGFRLALG